MRATDALRALGSKIKFWFALVGAILLAVSVLIFQSVTQLINSSRWVEHTYEVIDNIHLTTTCLFDARSAERSYFATHDKPFLALYQANLPRIHTNIAKLRSLTADNPEQQKRLEVLDSAIGLQFSRMSLSLAGARAGRTETADQLIADRTERANAQRISSVAKAMEDEERRLLKQRVSRVDFFAKSTLIASVGAILVSIFILAAVFWRIRRETREREAAQGKLYETNERLQGSLADLQLRDNAARSIALLGELLQTCRNTGEALAIAARHLTQLIPHVCGAIGLFNNSRDTIEASQMIGKGEGFAREFAPDECWGLRRGRLHESGGF